MAGEKRVELPPHVWTGLTGANITTDFSLTVNGPTIRIAAEASPAIPLDHEAHTYNRGERIIAGKLSDLFPNITSPNRLYAKPNGDVPSAVYISWS